VEFAGGSVLPQSSNAISTEPKPLPSETPASQLTVMIWGTRRDADWKHALTVQLALDWDSVLSVLWLTIGTRLNRLNTNPTTRSATPRPIREALNETPENGKGRWR
jgi:hypothetical protein